MRWLPLILMSALVVVLAAVEPAYALDPPHDFANCKDCHQPHGAPGGAITVTPGNANLCGSCHRPGQNPAVGPDRELAEADQAVAGPGLPTGINPSGTSHRWDSGVAGWAEADGSNTSAGDVESGGAYTGNYAKTYTITIATGGDVGAATFNWTDTRGCQNASVVTTGVSVSLNDTNTADDPAEGCGDQGVDVTFTDATSPSFVSGDIWRVYVRPDIRTPTNAGLSARIDNGKIMCSTCHNQHEQDATPFDPNAPGSGDGRHFQRLDNTTNQMCKDCHNARDVGALSGQGANQSHPVGRPITGTGYQTPTLVPADASNNVQCMSCHYVHDPVGAPTTDGTLLRVANRKTLCQDCHTLAGGSALHLDAASGVLWPGGQYGTCEGGTNASESCETLADCPDQTAGTFCALSTAPSKATETAERGWCTNCHSPHGWPDAANTSQDYASLLVARKGDLCFTCHDGSPATSDVYGQFNPSPALSDVGVCEDPATCPIDQVHDPTLCAQCHNPHTVTSSAKVVDPDPNDSDNFPRDYATDNTYGGQSYQSAAGQADPTFAGGSSANIGPAVKQTSFDADTAVSGGSYSVQGSETQSVYTVTVDTGATTITTTNTTTGGADDANDNDPVVFGTPIFIGGRGVTITFTDDQPSTRGPATCVATCDDLATAGGTYGGSTDGTYTVTVNTGGRPNRAVIDCTGLDCGGGTNVCGGAGPQCAYGTAFDVGGDGVTITFTDQGASNFTAGDSWTIAVTAGEGLAENEVWTITVDITSTPAAPDYVGFCLTCHDGTPPAGMPTGMLNIAATYVGGSGDMHGSAPGDNAGQGELRAVWNSNYPGGEHSPKYAALQCTTCHDQHGTRNIYHLKETIVVDGQTLQTYKGAPPYVLPCLDSSGKNPEACTTAAAAAGKSQRFLHWDAFCSNCHDHTGHNYGAGNETTTCSDQHRHGGTRF